MRILGTVGLPGSGKGEAAAVAREAGVPVVTMGDVIREACRDRGLDPTERHGEVAKTLREENGEAAIAERSLPLIRDALEESDTVLVDGLRSPAEVARFEAAFDDDFVIVGIEAPLFRSGHCTVRDAGRAVGRPRPRRLGRGPRGAQSAGGARTRLRDGRGDGRRGRDRRQRGIARRLPGAGS